MMLLSSLAFLALVTQAQKEDKADWEIKMADDRCYPAKSARECGRMEGCEWHEEEGEEKKACYDPDLWKKDMEEEGMNTADCKKITTQMACSGKCTWLADNKVCYNTAGWAKRQKAMAMKGAGCWAISDMNVCAETEGCAVDEGKRSGSDPKCRVAGGCWSYRQQGACAQNEMCTWAGDECMGLGGLSKAGGKCFVLGEDDCGETMGCQWMTKARGIGYCGRIDTCRGQRSEEDCDSMADDCYWVQVGFMGRSVCRPNDGVKCGTMKDEESCAALSKECVWAEHRGEEMRCLREDIVNDTRVTPCIQASGKRECDELPESMNCAWTTNFGVAGAPLGQIGRCLHLSCSELDSQESCEGNWQCSWDGRRQMCFSDKAVVCDFESRDQCLTSDECRWVWSEVRDMNFCQSVCLFHEVRDNEHLCRSFPSCSWGSDHTGEYRCHIVDSAQDKISCRSAKNEFECLQWDDLGAGCFYDEANVSCRHESCETYETEEKCGKNYQCTWLGRQQVCRSIEVFWCNGDDEDTCNSQPHCEWVTYFNRDNTEVSGCRHNCRTYEDEKGCINDESCMWGHPPGRPDAMARCRSREVNNDTTACQFQKTEEDCAAYEITSSVGCFWAENRYNLGEGMCKHEDCFDYDNESDCDADEMCRWAKNKKDPSIGACQGPQAYWCNASNQQECESNKECFWKQYGDATPLYGCRHTCSMHMQDEDACLLQDTCAVAEGKFKNFCVYHMENHDKAFVVDDACVDYLDEDECKSAPAEDGCAWLVEADFQEGGEHEGRRMMVGCRHVDCFNFEDEESCEANQQCNWHNRRQECFSPIDYHCAQIEDPRRCNNMDTCAWNSRMTLRGGEYRQIESCTAECRIWRQEEQCNMVEGCDWVTASYGFGLGQCMPTREVTLDDSYCNQVHFEEECVALASALGCAWTWDEHFMHYRCLHEACGSQTTQEGCTALYQCEWRDWPNNPDRTDTCVAPRPPASGAMGTNPCTKKEVKHSKEACDELAGTCVWGYHDDMSEAKCVMLMEPDGSICVSARTEDDCKNMNMRSHCLWVPSRNECVHLGCRNNVTAEDCLMNDDCQWVWQSSYELARYGENEGGFRCRGNPPCNPETCEPPICMDLGTYLDPELGCCGACVPDDCYLPERSLGKSGCMEGINCDWNKKEGKCQSRCMEIEKDVAERLCRNDSLTRMIIRDDDGCDVPQCVRPDMYCETLQKKKECNKAGDGICAWMGNKCMSASEEFDCSTLDRKQCKDAKDICLVVQKDCVAVATECATMTAKKDCKKLDKAHKKSKTGFAGCNWSVKDEVCRER